MSKLNIQQEGLFHPIPDKERTSFLLTTPENPKSLLVLSHGAGAGMLHANMEAIAEAMDSIGMAVFRYNFIYMQKGGGRESAKVSIETVKQATQHAHSLLPDLPIFVGGHSYGGRMSSLAAAEGFAPNLPIKGLIYFAFPLHAPGKPSKHRADHLTNIALPQLFLSGSRDTFSTGTLLEEVVEDLGELGTLHRIFTAGHGYKILKRTRTTEETVFEEMGRVTKAWKKKQNI